MLQRESCQSCFLEESIFDERIWMDKFPQLFSLPIEQCSGPLLTVNCSTKFREEVRHLISRKWQIRNVLHSCIRPCMQMGPICILLYAPQSVLSSHKVIPHNSWVLIEKLYTKVPWSYVSNTFLKLCHYSERSFKGYLRLYYNFVGMLYCGRAAFLLWCGGVHMIRCSRWPLECTLVKHICSVCNKCFKKWLLRHKMSNKQLNTS